MVGFITLRGSLSGSIRLTTVGKSTRFVLKLREKINEICPETYDI